ncbi:MAG: T9SS type A sorting domain-containing protein [Saprospiraceae bacterium]|nr:T9SS type A sorting domain-containing protein [Saprospiraceae bacterium]
MKKIFTIFLIILPYFLNAQVEYIYPPFDFLINKTFDSSKFNRKTNGEIIVLRYLSKIPFTPDDVAEFLENGDSIFNSILNYDANFNILKEKNLYTINVEHRKGISDIILDEQNNKLFINGTDKKITDSLLGQYNYSFIHTYDLSFNLIDTLSFQRNQMSPTLVCLNNNNNFILAGISHFENPLEYNTLGIREMKPNGEVVRENLLIDRSLFKGYCEDNVFYDKETNQYNIVFANKVLTLDSNFNSIDTFYYDLNFTSLSGLSDHKTIKVDNKYYQYGIDCFPDYTYPYTDPEYCYETLYTFGDSLATPNVNQFHLLNEMEYNEIQGYTDFDLLYSNYVYTASGYSKAFIHSLDENGNVRWSKKIVNLTNTMFGNYFLGNIKATVDSGCVLYLSKNNIDPITGENNFNDMYLLRFDKDGNRINVVSNDDALDIIDSATQYSIFPNPTDGFINIASNYDQKAQDVDISLYDAMGRLALNMRSQHLPISFDTSTLPKGVYSVSIIDQQSQQIVAKKLIVH